MPCDGGKFSPNSSNGQFRPWLKVASGHNTEGYGFQASSSTKEFDRGSRGESTIEQPMGMKLEDGSGTGGNLNVWVIKIDNT